nr:hypothetical transcript [Hymenolepis microstoma]
MGLDALILTMCTALSLEYSIKAHEICCVQLSSWKKNVNRQLCISDFSKRSLDTNRAKVESNFHEHPEQSEALEGCCQCSKNLNEILLYQIL